MKCKILGILLFVSFATLALSGIEKSTWRYSVESSEATGSVDKSLECCLTSESSGIALSCLSLWGPGASVEIRASISAEQITTEIASDGNAITTLRFTFDDSYENSGTGEMIINGNTATLDLNVTTPNPDKVIGARGSRQYNQIKFVLQKVVE